MTELNSLALDNSVSVMADHTYTFSPSVEKIKEYIDSGVVGKLLYYESQRFNLGIFQPDVSVIWDLAIHDLSIIGKLVGFTNLEWVSCVGFDPLGARQKGIATITMGFSSEFSVHITVNWLSPLKIRKVILGGQSGSIVFDDTEPSDKVALYAQEFDRPQSIENRISDLVSYKLGETKVPRLKNDEPLSIGIREFARSIEASKKRGNEDRGPLFETEELIKLLEMCETSMKQGGARIAFTK